MAAEGHIRIPNAVVDEWLALIGPQAFALLVCFGRFADSNKECFPSLARLMKVSGMSKPSVIKHRQTLEECKMIELLGIDDKGMRYRLNPPADWIKPNSTGKDSLQGSKIFTGVKNLYSASKNSLPALSSSFTDPSKNSLPEQYPYNKTQEQDPRTKPKQQRGTRLSVDWVLPDEWFDWALKERPDLTPECIRRLADGFRDYWISRPGSAACKLDWFATWRNRIRDVRAATVMNGRAANVTLQDIKAEELARIERLGL